MNAPKMSARLGAEFLGTFWLVFGGCGSAVIAAKFVSNPGLFPLGIGFVGVALAFGLTVLTMAYAVGHVSGAHFNPAVNIGLAVARRFEWKDAPAYVGTQVVAGLVAGGLLELIASGKPGFAATGNMAANGYGIHSPGGLQSRRGPGHRGSVDRLLPLRHSRGYGHSCARGIRPDRHRAESDPDSPHLDPDRQHFGQPGSLDRGGVLQRQRSTGTAVALLGGSDHRSGYCRCDLRHHHRGAPRGP